MASRCTEAVDTMEMAPQHTQGGGMSHEGKSVLFGLGGPWAVLAGPRAPLVSHTRRPLRGQEFLVLWKGLARLPSGSLGSPLKDSDKGP